MKIRTGFVSNSSSSSYVIAIAKVVDKEKFFAALEKEEVEMRDTCVVGVGICKSGWARFGFNISIVDKAFLDQNQRGHTNVSYRPKGGVYCVESFTYDEVRLDEKHIQKDDDMIMTIEESGCEDDSEFWDEEWGEYDYDKVDECYIAERYPKVLSDILDNPQKYGLEHLEWSCGAGRDG